MLLADRASLAGRSADVLGRSAELGVRVADLVLCDATLAELAHECVASHPVVDRADAPIASCDGSGVERHARRVSTDHNGAMAWTPFSLCAPDGVGLRDDTVTYGPHIPTEDQLRLLGDLSGKRVLDLGCGAGSNAIALARGGARAIALDPDEVQIDAARSAAEAAEVRVELHHGPLADLAFLRADTIDLAISVWALHRIEDPNRVFRQVHRILRQGGAFVVAGPHPTFNLLDPDDPEGPRLRHSAFDETPYSSQDPRHGTWARSTSALFSDLRRAGFSVDHVLEPRPEPGAGSTWSPVLSQVPSTLVVRARKEGV